MPKTKPRKAEKKNAPSARRPSVATIPPSPTKARLDEIEAKLAKLKAKGVLAGRAPAPAKKAAKNAPAKAAKKPEEGIAAAVKAAKLAIRKEVRTVPVGTIKAPPAKKETMYQEYKEEHAGSVAKEADAPGASEAQLEAPTTPAASEAQLEAPSTPIGAKAATPEAAKTPEAAFKDIKAQIKVATEKSKAPEAPPKAARPKTDRVPSGIPGFDMLVEGGFKKGSTVLVTGGPGSGKTTFLLQYLYDGAVNGEAGLFISFEEDEEELLEDFAAFGWDLAGMIRKKKLFFLNFPPHQVEKIMAQGGGLIKDMIKDAKVTRVAIDSLTSFSLLFKDEYEKREKILKFFDILAEWGCTILLTSERTTHLEDTSTDFGLEFLVDGAVILYNVRHGNVREQAIEVLKMRATNIKRKICPISVSKNGIQVFPDAEVFTEI